MEEKGKQRIKDLCLPFFSSPNLRNLRNLRMSVRRSLLVTRNPRNLRKSVRRCLLATRNPRNLRMSVRRCLLVTRNPRNLRAGVCRFFPLGGIRVASGGLSSLPGGAPH
jgi:hypothetical protein